MKYEDTIRKIALLIGYTLGGVAIFTLYLIIPLMITLNAMLPDGRMEFWVALPMIVLGELVIIAVLVRTLPRHPVEIPVACSPQTGAPDMSDFPPASSEHSKECCPRHEEVYHACRGQQTAHPS